MKVLVIKDKRNNEIFRVEFLDAVLPSIYDASLTPELNNKQLEKIAFQSYQHYKNTDNAALPRCIQITKIENAVDIICLLSRQGEFVYSSGEKITLIAASFDDAFTGYKIQFVEPYPTLNNIFGSDQGHDTRVLRGNLYRSFSALKILKKDRTDSLGSLESELEKAAAVDPDSIPLGKIKAFILKEKRYLEALIPGDDMKSEKIKELLAHENMEQFARDVVFVALYNAAREIYNNYVLAGSNEQNKRIAEFKSFFEKFGFVDETGLLLPFDQVEKSDLYIKAKAVDGAIFVINVNQLLKGIERVYWSVGTLSRDYARYVLENAIKHALDHINEECKEYSGRSPFAIDMNTGVTWKAAGFKLAPKNADELAQLKQLEDDIARELDGIAAKLGFSSQVGKGGASRGWQSVLKKKMRVVKNVLAEQSTVAESASVSLASSSGSIDSSSSSDTTGAITLSSNVEPVASSSTSIDLPDSSGVITSSVVESVTTSLASSSTSISSSEAPRRSPKLSNNVADEVIKAILKDLEHATWEGAEVFNENWKAGKSAPKLPTTIIRLRVALLTTMGNVGLIQIRSIMKDDSFIASLIGDLDARILKATPQPEAAEALDSPRRQFEGAESNEGDLVVVRKRYKNKKKKPSHAIEQIYQAQGARMDEPLPPPEQGNIKPLTEEENAQLVQRIKNTIEETTWVTKNIFGAASFVNISMGDDLTRLPKYIREIYIEVSDDEPSHTATVKMDNVKILADAAMAAQSKRRVESTKSVYQQLSPRANLSNQQAYFEKEAAFLAREDSGKRNDFFVELKQYIEKAEWKGTSLVRYKPERPIIENGVERILYLPKHVAKQYKILEDYFKPQYGDIVPVEKITLYKIQKAALDAVHDGGKRTRDDRTKEFYSILAGPKYAMEQRLKDFEVETIKRKEAIHGLLINLKAWIEEKPWLTQSGRLFTQDRYDINSYSMVHIAVRDGLASDGSRAKGTVSDLPANVRKQYELLEKYFKDVARNANVDAIKVLGEIQEIGKNVSDRNLSRRSIKAEDYYAVFKQSSSKIDVDDLRKKLKAVFETDYSQDIHRSRRK